VIVTATRVDLSLVSDTVTSSAPQSDRGVKPLLGVPQFGHVRCQTLVWTELRINRFGERRPGDRDDLVEISTLTELPAALKALA
jgi:hypothetical protein